MSEEYRASEGVKQHEVLAGKKLGYQTITEYEKEEASQIEMLRERVVELEEEKKEIGVLLVRAEAGREVLKEVVKEVMREGR